MNSWRSAYSVIWWEPQPHTRSFCEHPRNTFQQLFFRSVPHPLLIGYLVLRGISKEMPPFPPLNCIKCFCPVAVSKASSMLHDVLWLVAIGDWACKQFSLAVRMWEASHGCLTSRQTIMTSKLGRGLFCRHLVENLTSLRCRFQCESRCASAKNEKKKKPEQNDHRSSEARSHNLGELIKSRQSGRY